MADIHKEVLVGIISKNRASILPFAIESAWNQKNVKVLISVFDDNSSDDTKSLTDKYKEVLWYFSESNKGYLFGRNKLMSESSCPFYCSLDDDSWFIHGNELEIALRVMDSDSNIAAIAFDILSPDRPTPALISEPIETNIFIGCGHLLRLSYVEEVGYYEQNPGFYGGEEKDLCIKLMDKGYKIVKLPGVHVWHDKTMIARNTQAQHRSGVCNDLVFAFRRIPGLKMWGILSFKIFSHLRFSIFGKNKKLIKPCIQGLLDFSNLLIRNKLIRKPVSNATFRKFISLNK